MRTVLRGETNNMRQKKDLFMHRKLLILFLLLLAGCYSMNHGVRETTTTVTPKPGIYIQRLVFETIPSFKVEGVPLVAALERLGNSWETLTGTNWPVEIEDLGSKNRTFTLEVHEISYYELLHLLSEISSTNLEFTPDYARFFNSGKVVCVATHELVLGKETTARSGLPPGSDAEDILSWLRLFLTKESMDYVSSVEKMGPDRFLIIGVNATSFETVKSLFHLIQRGIKVTPAEPLP